MMHQALLGAFSILSGVVVASKPNITIDYHLTVRTTSGVYTGFVDNAVPGVKQWLGIRYGQPPIGKKRFMPPGAANDISTHHYAREYKPICFQQSGDHTGIFWELVPEFQNQDPQAEDCLFLNVWAPEKPVAEKLPVLIWACGGGFQEGGGHAPYQVPDQWVQRMKTHIVITFNYRLNVFGFPGARAARENAGLLDARMVVEWARDNIQEFGGDPERMIIWGQSAGAGLVGAYIYANGQDPIISGAVAMSGAASGGAAAVDDTQNNFSRLAELVNCGGLDAAEELACVQSVPALRLQDVVSSTLSSLPCGSNITVPRFGPVVDNVTMFSNLTERLEKNLTAKVPLLTGFTVNENAAFGGYSKNQTAPAPSSQAPISGLGCGVVTDIQRRLAYGLKTYRYLFAGNFSNITPRYWLGAMHSSDLPVVFGTHYQFRGNSTELEWQTSFAMEDAWVAFAADAANSLTTGSLKWPQYNADGSTMMLFGANGTAAQLVPGSYSENFVVCKSASGGQ